MAQLRRIGLNASMYPNAPGEYEDTSPGTSPRPIPIMETNPVPGGGLPPPAPVVTAPMIDPTIPAPQVPVPTVPYPSGGEGYIPMAQTWLQRRPWVLPVGGGIAAFLLGLTIGVAVARR